MSLRGPEVNDPHHGGDSHVLVRPRLPHLSQTKMKMPGRVTPSRRPASHLIPENLLRAPLVDVAMGVFSLPHPVGDKRTVFLSHIFKNRF